MRTSKYFIKCNTIFCILAVWPLFARRGGGGRLRDALPGSPLCRLGGGWLSQGTDVTIAPVVTTALCMRRKLNAATKFELRLPLPRNSSRVVTQQDVGLHTSHHPAGKLACRGLLELLCQCLFSPET